MTDAPTRRTLLGVLLSAPLTIGCSPPAELDVADFGGSPGARDNTRAFRAALLALGRRGGGLLQIGDGTYRFAAEALGAGGIDLPSGTTLTGRGTARSVLQVFGDAPCNLFVASDRSHLAIEAMTIVGNGKAVSSASIYGNGAAIRWRATGSSGDLAGFTLRNVHLENFGGPYWVDIENASASARPVAMSNVVLDDVTFESRSGNSPGIDDVRLNASVICISGQAGPVSDIRVRRLRGDARFIKSGIILYHHILRAQLEDVTIDNAGRDGAIDDAGAYAIQIYDSAYRLSGVRVARALIRNPRSVGIYVAGGSGVKIENPVISGQTDPRADTLPKGAIVFNGTRDWEVVGGTLSGNWRDLEIAMPAQGTPAAPDHVAGRVMGVTASDSETGIAIRHAAGHVGSGITIRDCRWRTRTRTVLVQNSAEPISERPVARGGYVNDIRLEGCDFAAGPGHRAVDLWGTSGSPAGGYSIVGCTLSGTNPLFARDHAGTLLVQDCIVADLGTMAATSAATLRFCPALDLRDCTFRSPGRGGIGIDLGGSAGTVVGLRFEDCSRRLPADPLPAQLGRGRPNFQARRGARVQSLEATSKTTDGWISLGAGTWKQTGA